MDFLYCAINVRVAATLESIGCLQIIEHVPKAIWSRLLAVTVWQWPTGLLGNLTFVSLVSGLDCRGLLRLMTARAKNRSDKHLNIEVRNARTVAKLSHD